MPNAAPTVTTYLNGFIGFINGTLIPVLFAIAFIVTIYYIYVYFILGAAKEESRKKGVQFVFYAVIGFALMLTIWGIVRVVIGSVNLNTSPITPPTFNSSGSLSPAGTGTTPTNNCDPKTGICTTPFSPGNYSNSINPAVTPPPAANPDSSGIIVTPQSQSLYTPKN
jgi:hypothetical protein